MIIKTVDGRSIDTALDMGPEERHILQKLMVWSSMVESLKQFRQIKQKALMDGWNNSGPVQESRLLSLVIKELEVQVSRRLQQTSAESA